MGKDLKGKELGVGISQQSDKLYVARFTDKFGIRKTKRFKKLQECRQWIADASYISKHSDIENASDILVDTWYEYWISIKKQTVRPNTVRNYSERYERNIKGIIGKKLLSEVKPIHCQKIFSDMAEQGYKTTTIYQTRITLYNMLEFAKENDVILSNPCKKSVKSDMGKPSEKKVALTIDEQRKFLMAATGQSYENQYKFTLQTGLRTGELVGLKWDDIDFGKRTVTISRTMEYRYKVGEWRVGPPKASPVIGQFLLRMKLLESLKIRKKRIAKSKLSILNGEIKFFFRGKGSQLKTAHMTLPYLKYAIKQR